MLITFEGIDGSGKTTQTKDLAAYLRTEGYEVLLTREPGGTLIGDQIREILHSLENTAMHPHTELLLYCASRAQLVGEVLRPFLAKGGVVICDRFIDSTLAYQGYGHGLDLKTLKMILKFATGGLLPDVTFYLDLAPEEGLKRRMNASLFGEEWNRLDDMEMSFHQRVYAGYRKLMRGDKRWVKIDALQTPPQIQATIRQMLVERLPELER